MIQRKTGLFLILFLFCSLALYPVTMSEKSQSKSIIYVDGNNTAGPWDGTLEHPYQHIQDGVDNASAGDTVLFSPDHTTRR